jgi:EAL and modified HD-GYP domain-containing signal transduction protein
MTEQSTATAPAGAISRTLLGYEPIIDRARKAIAMRITARVSGEQPVDLARLYAEMTELWPEGAIPVILRCEGLPLPEQLLQVKSSRHLWLEVPAAQATNPAGVQLIAELSRRGFVQVLSGRPVGALPPQLLPAFKMSIISVDEDRRLRDGPAEPNRERARTIGYAQSGVRTIAQLRRSFEAGAQACIGWPFDDAVMHAVASDSNPDFATITRLLSMIERDADPSDIEETIRRDAALAYRLLRYINSAAFGLTVEIQSFRHAVMMLGYERMKRWLLLMLTTASKDANMQPVMFASLRRGLFLENLVGTEGDATLRDEVFILGVLSLLDKLFREPLPKLLEKLYVAEPIRDALISRNGPHAAYLAVAESVEHAPDVSLADRLDEALVSAEQCNRALVRAVTVREHAPA